jgi:ABC-type antimicrobial peptide transport system permease subunit
MEIAVRRAVGARRGHISMLVFGSVAKLLLRASIAGIFLSLALSRTVEVFVPGLPAFELRVALAVVSLFAATTFLAAIAPLRSALAIAPARGE